MCSDGVIDLASAPLIEVPAGDVAFGAEWEWAPATVNLRICEGRSGGCSHTVAKGSLSPPQEIAWSAQLTSGRYTIEGTVRWDGGEAYYAWRLRVR